MATKAGTYPPTAANRNDSDKWVNVTWMPHSALSQTSHVRLSIRSAHAVLDGISHRDDENDWRVRIGVYGVAGLPLVPLSIQSTSAPVQKRPSRSSGSVTVSHSVMSPRATVAKATHDCEWNYFANVPIRWRDLPRDAYLHFEVLETDSVIYQCTMPFFSKYGKLETGLRKLKLTSGALDERRNHGLVEKSDSSEDNCAVWKACLALDQIERMEERTRADPTVVGLETFGHIPCVPWLDSLMKQRAKDIIASGVLEGTVSRSSDGQSSLSNKLYC